MYAAADIPAMKPTVYLFSRPKQFDTETTQNAQETYA
ncbi:MAG: hypothetical protein QG629_895 [Patescibacteria group bacterium]|nr:hypothetical protein [Patescibacteria group bacterium]